MYKRQDYIADPLVIAEIYRVLAPGGSLIVVLNGLIVGKQAAITTHKWPSVSPNRWPQEIAPLFTMAGFTLTSYTEPCTISLAHLLVASKDI